MIETVLSTYLRSLQSVINRGDAREESFYPCLAEMLISYAIAAGKTKTDITILPKATDAGNPDFRVWDGKNHITGYIEAKAPHITQLEPISVSEQLKRYLATFPNLLLTNFYEFRLYQHGIFIDSVTIARSTNAINSGKTPPLELSYRWLPSAKQIPERPQRQNPGRPHPLLPDSNRPGTYYQFARTSG